LNVSAYLDLCFALLFLVAAPALGVVSMNRLRRALALGDGDARIRCYRRVNLRLLIVCSLLLVHWKVAERSVADLGLVMPQPSIVLGVGLAFLFGAAAFLAYSRRRLAASPTLHDATRAQLGALADLLPHQKHELRYSLGMAALVGFGEELTYRGFLVWWLSAWMSPWIAIFVIGAAFGLAHLYQGKMGVLKTGIAGVIFGAVYLLAGNVWVPAILHYLVDAHAFRVAYYLHQNRSREAW
jgi:CAAX protease family protein